MEGCGMSLVQSSISLARLVCQLNQHTGHKIMQSIVNPMSSSDVNKPFMSP